MRLFNEFEREVIKRFEQYQVPVIELKKVVVTEAYDEGREGWDAEEPLEEAAS